VLVRFEKSTAPAQEHRSNDEMNKQLKPEARRKRKTSRCLAAEDKFEWLNKQGTRERSNKKLW
jgi:hypothetical protein